MSAPRRPSAFPIGANEAAQAETTQSSSRTRTEEPRQRKPRAASVDMVVAVPAEIDAFDEPDLVVAEPPPAMAPRRRPLLGRILLGAVGVLLSLAIGLWIDRLIRDLFERTPWLGWVAAGAAAIGVLALIVILAREFLAISHLAEVEKLQRRALDAIARNDPKAGRAVVEELSAFVAAKPETAS
jgi:putative membrane protein